MNQPNRVKCLRKLTIPPRKEVTETPVQRKETVKSPTEEGYRNQMAIPAYKALQHFWVNVRHNTSPYKVERWAMLNDRVRYAKHLVQECVHIDPLIRGGVPVVRGSRVPISLVLANIADNMTLLEIADDLNLDESKITSFVKCLAIAFDRPQHEYDSTRRVHELKEAD